MALVDLDVQFGDQSILLNLDGSQSIYDLASLESELTAETLAEVMVGGPAEMRVLLAPTSPEQGDLITGKLTRTILELLKGQFKLVIADLSSHLGEVELEVLERADKIVLIGALSLSAIKDSKLALKMFDSLGVSRERVVYLLNRCDDTANFSPASVESNLRVRIAHQIPFDRKHVATSIERGVPYVILAPDADISKRTRELAADLMPEDMKAAEAEARLTHKRAS